MEFEIKISIVPFPQARHRVSKCGVYDPSAKKKKVLSCLIKKQWQGDLIDGPCSVSLDFGMPIPKSLSKKKRADIMGQPHIKKGDIDNILKAVLDSMVGVILKDDATIYHVEARKFYVEQPFIKIKVIA